MNNFNIVLILGIYLLLLTLTAEAGRRKKCGRPGKPACKKMRACTCAECLGICLKRRPKKKPCWCSYCSVICPIDFFLTTPVQCFCKCTDGCNCKDAVVLVVKSASSSSEASEYFAIVAKRSSEAFDFSRDASRSAASASDSARSASDASSQAASASNAWASSITNAFAHAACKYAHDVLVKAVAKACECSKATVQVASSAASASKAWAHASSEAFSCAKAAAESAADASVCADTSADIAAKFEINSHANLMANCDGVEAELRRKLISAAAYKLTASMCLGVMTAAKTLAKTCATTSAGARAKATSFAKSAAGAQSEAWSCAKAIASSVSECEGHDANCDGPACIAGKPFRGPESKKKRKGKGKNRRG